jgi:hypothetical protein
MVIIQNNEQDLTSNSRYCQVEYPLIETLDRTQISICSFFKLCFEY